MTVAKLNFVSLLLDSPIADDTTAIEVTASTKYRKGQDDADDAQYYDLGPSGGILLTRFRATIRERNGSRVEEIGVNGVAHNGLTSDGRNKYILTVEIADDASTLMRGCTQNSDSSNAVTNVDEDLVTSSFPKGSSLEIVWNVAELQRLETLFSAATTILSKEAGENISIRNSVSLHTDGKIYKYHSTNYPNLVGIANETIVSGQQCEYTTYGGVSTGHSSLTIGSNYYAENTGAITITPSATTILLGTAETATSIRIVKAPDSALELSQAQVEDDASEVFGLVSGERLNQAIDKAIETDINTTFSFRTWDSVDLGDALELVSYYVTPAVTSDPIVFGLDIGVVTATGLNGEKMYTPIIGNGVSMSDIHLCVGKAGSPTDNMVVRIETDNNGEPSGTLAHANAEASVAGSALSNTNLADVTFTFGGAFTLTNDIMYHVVIGRSGALNDTNFYEVYWLLDGAGALAPSLHTAKVYQVGAWVRPAANELTTFMTGTGFYYSTDETQIGELFLKLKPALYRRFAGFAQEIKTRGNIVKSLLPGQIDKNQSGLDAGYVYSKSTTTAGEIIKSSTDPIGLALSATDLLITNDSYF